jgi:hypothetical protein
MQTDRRFSACFPGSSYDGAAHSAAQFQAAGRDHRQYASIPVSYLSRSHTNRHGTKTSHAVRSGSGSPTEFTPSNAAVAVRAGKLQPLCPAGLPAIAFSSLRSPSARDCHSASNRDPGRYHRKSLNKHEYCTSARGPDWMPIKLPRNRQF